MNTLIIIVFMTMLLGITLDAYTDAKFGEPNHILGVIKALCLPFASLWLSGLLPIIDTYSDEYYGWALYSLLWFVIARYATFDLIYNYFKYGQPVRRWSQTSKSKHDAFFRWVETYHGLGWADFLFFGTKFLSLVITIIFAIFIIIKF